jgi:4-amino-4-deoxy-L-arabinose transferase-like glycosyltransferase
MSQGRRAGKLRQPRYARLLDSTGIHDKFQWQFNRLVLKTWGKYRVISEIEEKSLRRWILAIMAAGAALRLWGLGFGLPFVLHPDEHNLTFHAMEALANRLNPGWFEYPSLMMYVLAFLYGLYYLVLQLQGAVESGADFWHLYQSDPVAFTIIGRAAVALSGIATLAVVFRLGRWAYGRSAALFAVLFLALAFMHVRDSHFVTVDVPLTLFCSLALLWAILGLCKDSSYLRLAALAAGLSIGTKYTGVFAFLPVLTATLLIPEVSWKKRLGLILQCGLITLAAFVLTTPYSLLDFSSFWRDIRYQFFTTQSVVPVYGAGGPRWLVYFTGELRWGLGLPLELLCMAGIGYALGRKYRSDWVILSFVIPYFLFTGFFSRHWARWILPVIPPLLVLGARLWAQQVARRYSHGPRGRAMIAAATVLILLVPLWRCVRSDYLLTRKDTRILAHEFLKSNPALYHSPGLCTAFSLPNLGRVHQGVFDYLQGKAPLSTPPWYLENQIMKDRPAFREGKPHMPKMPALESLLNPGGDIEPIRWVAVSSFYRNVIYDQRLMEAYPSLESYKRFYSDLRREGRMVFEASPAEGKEEIPFHVENVYAPTIYLGRMERPGPQVEIWDLAFQE